MVGNQDAANRVETLRDEAPNRPQQRRKSRPDPSSTREFKRAYKACVLCRASKAKCELPQTGDNSLPSGPCMKCQRERKDCEFTATRSSKKRQKLSNGQPDSPGHRPSHPARSQSNSQSRTRENVSYSDDGNDQAGDRDWQSSFSQHPQATHDRIDSPGAPRNDWLNANPTIPPPNLADAGESDESDSDPTDPSARPRRQSMIQRSVLSNRVMRTVVTSSNDALGLLFQAVEQHNGSSSDELQPLTADAGGGYHGGSHSSRQPDQHISPHSVNSTSAMSRPIPILQEQLSSASPDVLKLWNKCRFVKQGWFTAKEAVTYIDLFAKNCAPLTPILTDQYFHHSNHHALVTEEPLLCCTILMISSRIHVLPGMGGTSRAHFIHGRLWQHLEHLISRVIFGQEKISTAKTRTLGTIEGLLLMTEWHPRALHFPPESDGWDFDLLANPDLPEGTGVGDADDSSALYRWREEVFEPAKRSDRMSWMLVGTANSLAHELGIFSHRESPAGNKDSSTAHEMRRLRVLMLLCVYTNQLAARLGCTTLVPENAPHCVMEKSSLAAMTKEDQCWHSFMTCWIEITTLMETVTDMFFPSPAFTRQLLLSGRYKGLLKHFQPLLSQWYEKSTKLEGISTPFRDILFLEYHYIRMYVNSLSIQAIVERTVSQSNNPTTTSTASHETSSSQPSPDELLVTSISASDYSLISEVIDASVQILKKTIALSRLGQLIYTPVRVYVRTVSASIFLLKAISLGGRNTDIQSSLAVLDECIQTLQSSPSDEVHLGSCYGTLLERHVCRFRRNFVGTLKAGKTGLHRSSALTVPPLVRMGAASFPGSNQGLREHVTNPDVPVNGEQRLGVMAGQDGTFDLDGMQYTTHGSLEMTGNLMEDWLAQPFDPNIAPFGAGGAQFMSGLELGSLDFLWNLPG